MSLNVHDYCTPGRERSHPPITRITHTSVALDTRSAARSNSSKLRPSETFLETSNLQATSRRPISIGDALEARLELEAFRRFARIVQLQLTTGSERRQALSFSSFIARFETALRVEVWEPRRSSDVALPGVQGLKRSETELQAY